MKMTTSPRVLSERRDASNAGRASVERPQERSFRCLGVLSARAGDAGEPERGRDGLPSTTTSVSRAERRSQMTTGLSTVVAAGAGGGGRRAVIVGALVTWAIYTQGQLLL